MGAGVCTLASDIPENREVIGDSGFTFRAGDAADLERMLRLLIASPQIREACGLDARQRVSKLYPWDRVAAEIQEIYVELMKSSSSAAKAASRSRFGKAQSDTDLAA
jgi:glycosyltransferase involved in cell wall biosynthesis